ncbi:unnamed protein product [marine sediment metagenome]|uniref:DUF721 domain-containing protein n=1 Tax=marine sediment metagenome TaxID=412755 RepID=X0XFA5_9ZZZZ
MRDDQLRDLTRWRKKPDRYKVTPLGKALDSLMENRISPQQAESERITQAWKEVLPYEFQGKCKLVKISAGRLTVVAVSPSYANKLWMCRREIIEELQDQCPRAKIKKIKIIIGREKLYTQTD